MANTNKRPEEVPEQRIKLTVNYLTDEDYESIDKTRLSTELSNQLFMTPGNGDGGGGGGIKECAMTGRGAAFDQMTSDVGQIRSGIDAVKNDVRSLSADAVGKANGISSDINSLSSDVEMLKSQLSAVQDSIRQTQSAGFGQPDPTGTVMFTVLSGSAKTIAMPFDGYFHSKYNFAFSHILIDGISALEDDIYDRRDGSGVRNWFFAAADQQITIDNGGDSTTKSVMLTPARGGDVSRRITTISGDRPFEYDLGGAMTFTYLSGTGGAVSGKVIRDADALVQYVYLSASPTGSSDGKIACIDIPSFTPSGASSSKQDTKAVRLFATPGSAVYRVFSGSTSIKASVNMLGEAGMTVKIIDLNAAE